MSGKIKLAPNCFLPIEMVGESTTIIAKKGAGKSNTAKVIVEGAMGLAVQCVVLDPIGHWWGLRSLFPVPVIGGPHADVPLEPHAGKLLAEVAVESGQSMILDVSGLDSDGAMQRFAYEFAEKLYTLKQAHPSPLLLALEEADEFAPQDTRGANVARMVGAYARIAKRGRGRGLGLLAVTQRSASLSKNVLDQSDTLIVMRTVGPRDRKAIEDWVKHQDAVGMDSVIPSLPSLATGEAWLWTPELNVLERINVYKARSLDTSESSIKSKGVDASALKPIDLAALGSKIAETAARVKADDPKELRKRIRELEGKVTSSGVQQIVEVEKIVEVPVFTPDELHALTAATAASHAIAETAESLLAALGEVSDRVNSRRSEKAGRQYLAQPPAKLPTRHDDPMPTRHADPMPVETNGEVKLGKGELKVLGVLSEFPDGRTQNELAFLAGYSAKASTIGVLLSNLRKAGLVEPGQPIRPTREGLATVGGPVERPTGDALLQQWLHHPRMGKGERSVLLALIDLYPHVPSNEELCDLTGYSPGASTMGVLLSNLRKLGLVEKGARRVAPELMEAIS